MDRVIVTISGHSLLSGEKMDNFIAQYHFKRRNGLNLCIKDGVAYQSDMSVSVPYDKAYFDKYMLYEVLPIGKKLNDARLSVVKKWAKDMNILDIGIGCGTFVKYALSDGLNIWGYDINPYSIHWLRKLAIYDDPIESQNRYFCYTFWDSLEHISEPQKILEKIPVGAYIFISIPIFNDLEKVNESKHYRPNEHYYYFTSIGLIRWMTNYNLHLIKVYDFEQKAGREGILTFLFERLPITKIIANRETLTRYFEDQIETTEIIGNTILKGVNNG